MADLVIRWQMRRVQARDGLDNLPRLRALLDDMPAMLPPGVRVRPDRLGGIAGEWAESGYGARTTLLYLHGGGFVAGSPRSHRCITGALARRGFSVFAPDYRLAPEHPFPAGLDDAVAAWRALRAASPGRLVAAGDSAGGTLALSLLLTLRDAGEPMPAAAALFSPATDLAGTGASLHSNRYRDAMLGRAPLAALAAAYLAGADPRTPLASPLHADLTGLPPLLIHVGEREVLRDDATRLAERAEAAGVPVTLLVWPVVPHVWQLADRTLPEARRSLDAAAAFLHGE